MRAGPRPDRWLPIVALLAVAGTARGGDDAGRALFEEAIRPVLIDRCERCHSDRARSPKGGLRLDTPEGVLRGGDSGPAVVPGDPGASLLIQALEGADGVEPMPPKGRLDPATVAAFRRWVELGAPVPGSGANAPAPAPADPRDWWSLRPLARPPVPALAPEDAPRARNPVDAFVLARLRAEGLEPAPEADRRTLIRRLSFDLIGLPPTPGEIDAFLTDPAPDAYEKLVDRLLASPHYGERQARHWLDLVHFAETHGHDQDRVREHAWLYRDYVIDAFNRDTPYARFVGEQVAADVLYPEEPAKAVALGFLAAGPWDESSLRDIREDTLDREVGRYLDRDDMIATVFATFASTTVHCARCHDHKFDPIPTADYYALQAVFAGVDRADRAFDPDPATAARRKTLADRREALRRRDPAILAELLGPEVQAEVADWESRRARPAAWRVLAPEQLAAEGGSTLTVEPDGSILAGGDRPSAETYTVRARVDLRGMTALRLEVLPDDRLPSKGPGRNPNGNLHLTEFRVRAAPAGRPEAAEPLTIAAASADFEQDGWGVRSAIDGDDRTAWGILPRVGVPHQAVFELAEPIDHEGGTLLTVELRQVYPVDHPIGRFRLAATASPRPVGISTLPDPIAAILAMPQAGRIDEQRRELAAYVLAGALDGQLAALPPRRKVYAAAAEFEPDGSHKPAGAPRAVHVLRRGDIRSPGPAASPGALSCLPALNPRFELPEGAPEGGRRAALARWLAHPENPLTWRSIVNRAWQHHFGRGIVDTPNDFGRMGSTPSHPELLDWLAVEFRDGGGSLKALHRLLVTSAAYRRESRHDLAAAAVDAENRLLWRQNRRRLDADQVRDAVLLASGRLDRAMGGPSVRHFSLGPGVHVTPTVDYRAFSWDAPGASRRSVYRFVFRTLPDPFMDALDAADASQLTPARNESLTPLQALALLNNQFVLAHAAHLARRVESEAPDLAGRVRAAFAHALGRPPGPDELADWSGYAAAHGLERACRMLFNGNEFLFVE